MPVQFSSNIRAVRRTLKSWQRNQVPFAASLALNDVAFQTREFTINRLWPNSFPRAKNRRFPGVMFRVQKASKRRLQSALFDRLNIEWIDAHIEGGAFTDRTIPTDKVKRTANGKIRRNQLPFNIPNSFKADRTGRGEAVWQETRQGLKLMYVDKGSVTIKPVFPFYRAGEQFARTRLDRAFEKAIDKALRTARPAR